MTRSHESTIPLSRPDVGPAEIARVTEALSSGRLALGPQNREFERRMARITGAQYAVAVSSGTAALHLILEAMGVGPGDEVITTPFSFVASANAALFVGARPVFADIDPVTFNVDPEHVASGISARTRAILAVDVFGQPADWYRLAHIAERHNLLLVDDGCEALGASVGERPVGSLAGATAFGFYPNKQITTGEGGCVTTDNEEVAELVRSMANQGRDDAARMRHVRLGYNYRLSEIAAAIGCAQLERLDELESRRRQVADLYAELLAPLSEDIQAPAPVPGTRRSWFSYVIKLSDDYDPAARDELMTSLGAKGIQSAHYFPCIHLQPLYRDRFGYEPGAFPIAESVAERTLALPFFTTMREDEVEHVVRSLESLLPRLPRTGRPAAVTGLSSA